jgi:hypothetical protein
MARLTLYIVALSLGAIAAVGLVSCGGSDDDLLPGSSADQILDNLDTVEELVAEGSCDEAVSAAAEIRDQVERLPRSVDAELRQRLIEGADRLEEVAASDCTPPTTVTETAETTDETTAPEETEPEETEPEEEDEPEKTEPTETEPTETQPTETQPTTPTNGDSGGIGPSGSSGFQGGSG